MRTGHVHVSARRSGDSREGACQTHSRVSKDSAVAWGDSPALGGGCLSGLGTPDQPRRDGLKRRFSTLTATASCPHRSLWGLEDSKCFAIAAACASWFSKCLSLPASRSRERCVESKISLGLCRSARVSLVLELQASALSGLDAARLAEERAARDPRVLLTRACKVMGAIYS